MERNERIFLAALGQLNQEVGRYVLRMVHEATGLGVTEYTRPLSDLEQELGANLVRFGHQLIERSEVRGISVVEAAPDREEISGQPLVITGPSRPEVPQ